MSYGSEVHFVPASPNETMTPAAQLTWAEFGLSAGVVILWCLFEATYASLAVLSVSTGTHLAIASVLLHLLAVTGLAGIVVHAVMLNFRLTQGGDAAGGGMSFSVASALLVALSVRLYRFNLRFSDMRLLRKVIAVDGIRYGDPKHPDRPIKDGTKGTKDETPITIFVFSKRHTPDPENNWELFGRLRSNAGTEYGVHAFDITRGISPRAQAEWKSVVEGNGTALEQKLCIAMLVADLMPTRVRKHPESPPLFGNFRRVEAGWNGRVGESLASRIGAPLESWKIATARAPGASKTASKTKTWELMVVTCLEYYTNIEAMLHEHQEMVKGFRVPLDEADYLWQLLIVLVDKPDCVRPVREQGEPNGAEQGEPNGSSAVTSDPCAPDTSGNEAQAGTVSVDLGSMSMRRATAAGVSRPAPSP